MSDKFGKNVDKRTAAIGTESNPSGSNDEVSETRDDLEHLKLAEGEENKESKTKSAGKEGAGSPSRKTRSKEPPEPEPKPGTSRQQMQLNPEDVSQSASVLPEAEMQILPSRDSEKDLADTKEDQKSMDFGNMPYKDVLHHFLRDEDVHRESTPSEDGDTLSDVSEIRTQTAGSSLEGSVYQDAQSSVKSEPSVSRYHDAVGSLNADDSASNSLRGLPSLTSSEPTGVTTVSTPTGEQGNDRYRERLEQEARERGDPPSTSSEIGSTNRSELDNVANWVEGERIPRQSRQYEAPVMRDVVPSSESASEEQGNEQYLEDLNKEARQRNYDEGSLDASSVEHSDLENIQKWMDGGKRTKSKSSPEKIGGVELSKRNDSFEKHLPTPQSLASSDDSRKHEENKHGRKYSLPKTATEIKCSRKDEKPGPRLKVQYATIERIGTIEAETVAPLGTEVPLPDTDSTLKESGMSPKQMEVGSPVEPESVPESTETRDTTLKKDSILRSALSSLKYSDLKGINLHGKAIQSTSMRHIGSELKSIYSRATFSETSNIEDENTDSRISSTLDLVSSTTLELERGIKKSTECMELEESSKIVGTRKSWQKSGSLRKLQHSSIESTEGGKGDPLGIEEPITDVELAKSPEQMDVSLPSPDSTVPEGDQLHEMQSGPEHGLESKFQSEESGETPSEASDIKDGRPDSRLSSSVEPFSTSSDLSHGLGSSIESSESEGPTILRSAPKSSPKPCSLHKIHYATMTRVETIEEETRFDPLFEQQTEYFGMSLEEMGSPVEREFAPETADKDETVNHDITEKVQSESGDAAPERLLSGSETSSETRRPSVVLKSEEQSSKPERKQDSSSIATCAPKSGKRSRKKARLDKDKKVKHPASPKKRVRRRSSGSVSESTGELSGSGTNSDSNNSAGN